MSVTLNGIDVKQGMFPNGEIDYTPLKRSSFLADFTNFKLIFESNVDLFNLQVVKKWWDDNSIKGQKTRLDISFFPYSQMDRDMKDHLFSLKYVAQIINDMKFDRVLICDPHSNVLPALLDRVHVIYPVETFIDVNGDDYDLLFYPDNGAAKKYSEILDKPYRFGNKKRNLKTGEIECYEVIADEEDIRNKNILIVDDLVMGGRTFVEAAKALREKGAKKVDLYVTHLMPQARNFYNSKGNGLLDNIHSEDTLGLIPVFEMPEPRP